MNVRRERGVALIAAVLVVALATVLIAAMLDRSEAALARTRNLQRAEQGWELMRGVEAWAAQVLVEDFNNQPNIDSHEDIWAQEMPPIELPGVRIHGRLQERNGCFNLNSLHPDGADDSIAIARFQRLLRALQLDIGLADQAIDWMDADSVPRSQGAEDAALLTRQPAQRTANQPFAHVSEVRLLPGVTPEVYATLAPEVCTLPGEAATNLNFASAAVWMSLSDAITPTMATRLAREGRANYDSLDAITQELLQLGVGPVPLTGYGVSSDWFVLEAQIVADGIPFSYSSLLHRQPSGVHVVGRARGSM